jgi:hypothetical protein
MTAKKRSASPSCATLGALPVLTQRREYQTEKHMLILKVIVSDFWSKRAGMIQSPVHWKAPHLDP